MPADGGDASALPSGPPVARIAALATAVPPYTLAQEDVAQAAIAYFARHAAELERLVPVYANSAIATRHSCVPLDWYSDSHDFRERNDLYLDNAVALLAQAAQRALDQAGLQAGDVDGLITVSSTGIATPALDARLMARLPLRRDVERLPVFGLGCAGGVLGLARAAQMARAAPAKRYLLLVVELCGLTFRVGDRSKSNIIATALFGDGAAAAIVTCAADRGPAVRDWAEHTFPDSLDVMGWDVGNDGLKVIFSKEIPGLVERDVRALALEFLARHGLGLGEVAGFVCHPGGAKVLAALETAFDLAPGGLDLARKVLREHGNMSAPTVLFVLREALDAGAAGPHLMTALGPGFSAALALLDLD
ncbi:type III polyketide synthase [Zavarzinia sp. CC-PAN008]|uniref:type III polyketide synthase n=1 Tax=Zavarzinia sp. CC-PAN008 TaxID=3243332 RepID=UPI003F744159